MKPNAKAAATNTTNAQKHYLMRFYCVCLIKCHFCLELLFAMVQRRKMRRKKRYSTINHLVCFSNSNRGKKRVAQINCCFFMRIQIRNLRQFLPNTQQNKKPKIRYAVKIRLALHHSPKRKITQANRKKKYIKITLYKYTCHENYE